MYRASFFIEPSEIFIGWKALVGDFPSFSYIAAESLVSLDFGIVELLLRSSFPSAGLSCFLLYSAFAWSISLLLETAFGPLREGFLTCGLLETLDESLLFERYILLL